MSAAQRLRLALELFDAGYEMMRLSLERRHPTASSAEIDRLMREWLQRRPGAEHGDCPGVPRRLR